MKRFGPAGGRSVHQIVLQRATQEIIHQVGEESCDSIQMRHDENREGSPLKNEAPPDEIK